MKLSSLKVLELNKKLAAQGKKPLIENLCERELKNPEGVELELRVGAVERIAGSSFLGVNNRYSAKTEIVGDIDKRHNKKITMWPGSYFLVKTIEIINCPEEKIKYDDNFPEGYLVPDIRPRVSLQKAGISLNCSTTNPGYSGQLVFGLSNNSQHDFEFELGARMFKIYFVPVIGEIKRTYSGQHQGGRTSSLGKVEKQN